jgi:hypothetical protein
MPCHWGDAGLPGFAGRVRFSRHFGYPGRIDDYERVWLTFGGVEGTAQVSLNGRELGQLQGSGEFDVTGLLRARNELVVEVESASDRGGLWDEVALEVRRTAYLRNVQARWLADTIALGLEVRGEVVGVAERPLELYAILDRSNVAYAVIPAGQTFVLTTEDLNGAGIGEGPHVLRIDLVDAATVWYSLELPLERCRRELGTG